MRFPPGVNPEKAIIGYIDALKGFPIEAIAHGIRRFLRGECPEVNPKFCPHPPELATIVRGGMPDRPAVRPTGKLYRYSQPKSRRINKRPVTKDAARGLVYSGQAPRGSIWCPGDFLEGPEYGDLFEPDDTWMPATPFNPNERSAS